MNDVFISYSRRNKDFTRKLYDALIEAKRTVWADWDSIPAASDWFAEIKQGIEQTNTVLFVLSSEWIKSNECRKELEYAIGMGKRLLPILYEMVDPNDVPPELAKINWIYMRDSDDFETAFQTLLKAMDTDLDWIKTHTRIQIRAIEWDKKNRDHSFVLRGKDLTDGESFVAGATGKTPEMTPLQGEYILVSRKDATRRQRITMAGVVIALIVSIALGVAAFFQRQAAVAAQLEAEAAEARAVEEQKKAEIAQLLAEAEAREALSGQLSLEAENSLAQYPQRSVLLALEAIKVNQDANEPVRADAEEALRLALQNMTGTGLVGFEHNVSLIHFTDDAKWLVAGTNVLTGEIKIWNMQKALSDPTYKPSYLTFPTYANSSQQYGSPDTWLPLISVSPQTHWLIMQDENETKLYQIDDEDEIREPITFSGNIEFVNTDSDYFLLESLANEVIYWEIDPETFTKKELATFTGSFVTISPDRSILITDDPTQGLLQWNFTSSSKQSTLLTTKHAENFFYSLVTPTNEWLVLFENTPRTEYQIQTYDSLGNLTPQPWNSTTLVLISLAQRTKQEFQIATDLAVDIQYLKPKFSEDGNSLAYVGSNPPDEFGNLYGMGIGVVRFTEIEFINFSTSSKTETIFQFSFIKNNWLLLETYDSINNTSVSKFIDLRENDLFVNAQTSLGLQLDIQGNVIFADEKRDYLLTLGGDVINFYQLDFNQFLSIEPPFPNSESQITTNTLEYEVIGSYRKLGMENYPTGTTTSKDGNWFAVGGFDGSVRVWNNLSPRENYNMPLNAIPNFIALSNDNQWLAINGALWKLENGIPKEKYAFEEELNEYGYSNTSLAVFSPNSKWLIYIQLENFEAGTNSINLIDLNQLAQEGKINSTQISKTDDTHTTVRFSPNSEWLLIGSDFISYSASESIENNTGSFIYNLENNKYEPLPTRSPNFVFTEDGTSIIFVVDEIQDSYITPTGIEIWSLPQNNQPFEKIGELKTSSNITLSENGRWLISLPDSYTDTFSKLWDLTCVIQNTQCNALDITASGAGFSPNSQYLITFAYTNALDAPVAEITHNIWNLQSNIPELTHTFKKRFIYTPSISNTGNLQLFTKPNEVGYISPFVKTAGMFSNWSGYNSIGAAVTTYNGYGHITFSGGAGAAIPIGGYQADYIVEAFFPQNHSTLSLRGHESNVSMSQISLDEKFVITFSGSSKDDGTASENLIRLWDIERTRLDPTWKPVALPLQLDSATGNLQAIAISPNSQWVYAIDEKNILYYHPIFIEDLQIRACQAVGRNLTLSEWERFFPNTAYRKTCEDLPEHPSALTQ